MKFNEKLINLRKSKGMPQEELGEKLNVTRQTVSKWELGQTTPEMDKLKEISKFFGMTLDELTNEENINTEGPIINNEQNGKSERKRISVILIVLLVIFLLMAIGLGITKIINGSFGIFKNAGEDLIERVQDKQKDIINTTINMQQELLEQAHNQLENKQEEFLDGETQNQETEKLEETQKVQQQSLEQATSQLQNIGQEILKEETQNQATVNTERVEQTSSQPQHSEDQQKLLEEAQKKQQELLEQAQKNQLPQQSAEQQKLLEEAQKRQQELLQEAQKMQQELLKQAN